MLVSSRVVECAPHRAFPVRSRSGLARCGGHCGAIIRQVSNRRSELSSKIPLWRPPQIRVVGAAEWHRACSCSARIPILRTNCNGRRRSPATRQGTIAPPYGTHAAQGRAVGGRVSS